ncbi:hypothetical protein SeMB42_g02147 [Synchytrium endobioticum]|uniref:Uncharacterized protein n=1 Tax=Synchytrium endobioticum TaxID=286115 RepID=A0A507DIJ9_9FUNG|nr:hypothetical protein SeMB42_g02147 [Synchytrium endobioticum]
MSGRWLGDGGDQATISHTRKRRRKACRPCRCSLDARSYRKSILYRLAQVTTPLDVVLSINTVTKGGFSVSRSSWSKRQRLSLWINKPSKMVQLIEERARRSSTISSCAQFDYDSLKSNAISYLLRVVNTLRSGTISRPFSRFRGDVEVDVDCVLY